MVTLKFNLKINNASREAVVKRMKNSIKIPVEYTIYTTSDWTQFEIVEGGYWQDLKIDCIRGEDRLIQDIVVTDNTIYLEKESYDVSPVTLQVKCFLNIDKAYKQSKIKYRILKGEIQSTIVTITVYRKKLMPLLNNKSTIWDEDNQETFDCPAKEYICDLRQGKVFIIHGRDDYQVLRLKDFLNKHKVRTITLSDLKDEGKTISQKLYDELSNITHAFAILTPDDVGCLKKDLTAITGEKISRSKETIDRILQVLQGRARQNVLLELGLFIGVLGKENICYLKQKDVELPSNLDGVLYKEFKENVDETFPKLIEELFLTD